MTLKELLTRKAEIENQITALQQTIEPWLADLRQACADVVAQINEMLAQRLHDLRQLQGKEFGVVHLVLDGVKVTETIDKTVSWDQEKLGDIFGRIVAAGDKPADYMRMKLDVPKKMYSAFPDQIKGIFAEARTVKGGRPALKFEGVENA